MDHALGEHEPKTGGTGGLARGSFRTEEGRDAVPDLLRNQVWCLVRIARNIESKMVDGEACMTHLRERCFCFAGVCLCVSCLTNLLFVFSRTRDVVPHVCCHIMSVASLFVSQLVF